jgi:hypothetical protein
MEYLQKFIMCFAVSSQQISKIQNHTGFVLWPDIIELDFNNKKLTDNKHHK